MVIKKRNKITMTKKLEILTSFKNGARKSEIEKKYNVSASSLCLILKTNLKN